MMSASVLVRTHLALTLCLVVFAAAAAAAEPAAKRVVSIGGSLTEIIYALGEQDRLVARDTTSIYPDAAQGLADVGYMRRLSAEGILAVDPDLILAEEGSGPPETIELLNAARVPFVTVPDGFDRTAIAAKIQAVADRLGVPDKGAKLAAETEANLQAAEVMAAGQQNKKRVMFILSTQGGRIMASGRGTAADGIIALSGAINALEAFEGYKPVTEEAITAAAPDAILMMDRGGGHGTVEQVLGLPAIATTPAAQSQSVVTMNGLYLLGFGPRTAQAAFDLNAALYGSDG